MLCTDIQIEAGEPERTFIEVWNRMVDEKVKVIPELQGIFENNENVLKTDRAKELIRLIEEVGRIEEMPYELVCKVLNHIEVGEDGVVMVEYIVSLIPLF